MNKAIILDTESTGLIEPIDAVEIAYFYLDNNFNKLEESSFYSRYIPNVPIHPKASEVHGFTLENLKGQPSINTFVFPTDVNYLIGHNILYDYRVLKQPKNVKLICSKELSIKYLTNQSGAGTKGVNTLTGLIERYYPEEAKELIAKAHSALHDCKLCYLILLKVLEVAPELDSFEKLAEQCSQPAGTKHGVKLPPSIKQDPYTKEYMLTFGKYKGLAFSRIDKVELHKYLTWIVEVSSLSLDLKDFVKQFLKDNK